MTPLQIASLVMFGASAMHLLWIGRCEVSRRGLEREREQVRGLLLPSSSAEGSAFAVPARAIHLPVTPQTIPPPPTAPPKPQVPPGRIIRDGEDEPRNRLTIEARDPLRPVRGRKEVWR